MQDRETHEMDRFRVEFVAGEGWTCECEEIIVPGSRKHTRTAAAMRTLERQAAERGGSAARQ